MEIDLPGLLFALFCVSVVFFKNDKGGVLFALFCVSVILCNGTMKRGAIRAILRFCIFNAKRFHSGWVAIRAIMRFCISIGSMSPLGLLFALFCVSVFSMKRDLTELLFALFCVSVISLKNEKGGVLFALFCVSVILCNGTMKRGAIRAILRFCVNWKHKPLRVAIRAILRFCIFNDMIPY